MSKPLAALCRLRDTGKAVVDEHRIALCPYTTRSLVYEAIALGSFRDPLDAARDLRRAAEVIEHISTIREREYFANLKG